MEVWTFKAACKEIYRRKCLHNWLCAIFFYSEIPHLFITVVQTLAIIRQWRHSGKISLKAHWKSLYRVPKYDRPLTIKADNMMDSICITIRQNMTRRLVFLLYQNQWQRMCDDGLSSIHSTVIKKKWSKLDFIIVKITSSVIFTISATHWLSITIIIIVIEATTRVANLNWSYGANSSNQ